MGHSCVGTVFVLARMGGNMGSQVSVLQLTRVWALHRSQSSAFCSVLLSAVHHFEVGSAVDVNTYYIDITI